MTCIRKWNINCETLLFLIDRSSLQASTLLDQVFTDFGLQIKETKTEMMILNHCYLGTDYPDSIIYIRNVPLKNTVQFMYLGSCISSNEPNTGDIEINFRIQMALGKFASMSNLLQNHGIHLSTRVKFLNSFVRSRLTYSCQNWNLTTAQFVKLDITYRTLLRRMVRRGSIELILMQTFVLRSITKSFIIFAILKMLVFLFENNKRTVQVMSFECLLTVVLSN